MEEKLPLPLPDRRIIKARKKSNENHLTIESNDDSKEKFNELKESKLSVMSTAKIMQIEDMRQKIINYKLLSDKMIYLNSSSNHNIHKCNIIIFGPQGGGKTSFILSLYKSLPI